MGCDKYTEDRITFSENDDTVGCLCTFPHNDRGTLDKERVRSLAYLGAAVVLLHRREIDNGFLPSCLPQWIRDGIDSALNIETRDQIDWPGN